MILQAEEVSKADTCRHRDVAQWLIAFISFFLIRTAVMYVDDDPEILLNHLTRYPRLFTLRLLPRTEKKSAWAIYAAFALNIAILMIAVISCALQYRPFADIWRKIPNDQCVSIDVLAVTNQVNASESSNYSEYYAKLQFWVRIRDVAIFDLDVKPRNEFFMASTIVRSLGVLT